MEVRDIVEKIREQMEDADFLKKIGDALRGQNKEKFRKEVDYKLENIFNPEKDLLNAFDFFAGGIHYISPSLGDWFRFNFGHNIELSDKLITDELESAYREIPKEYNLTTWDELKVPVKYLFLKTESNGKDVFTLNEEMINTLLKYMNLSKNNTEGKSNITLQKFNYFKYVVGGDYIEDKEKGEKEFSSIENANGFDNSLKPILESYYNNHLKSKLTKEGQKTLYETGDGNEKYRYDHLFRLLTFSCFFSLMKLEAENLTDTEKREYKFGLVIPFRVLYSDIIKQERLLNYGGFGGIFTDSLEKEEIEDLTLIFEYIVNRLICLEMSVLSRKGQENVIVAEDTIRLCTRIDNDKVVVLKNGYNNFLNAVVETHLKELTDNNLPNDDLNLIKKIIGKEISKKFIGCNEHFIEILERILVTLKKEYEDNFKEVLEKDKKKKDYCSTIFLYGEEGVGKEVIAKICHIVNPRYYNSVYIPTIIKFYYDNYYSKETDSNKPFNRIMKIGDVKTFSPTDLETIESIKSHLPPNSPFFNYTNVNMATLDKDTFPKIIFGEKVFVKESEPFLGELEIASVLGGTLFMDEIDKLDSKLANQLLKVLEDPYIYQRYGEKKKRYANLLIVFASNKRLEEFTHDTFSSAFIYRIGRNYFEIPPLRMRREDIALFIWDKISSQKKQKIKSIDLRGLRLLCELPWLNNYRGLDSFIRTLFMEREIRKINSSEISFDEIIRVIRKLELLKKKSLK